MGTVYYLYVQENPLRFLITNEWITISEYLEPFELFGGANHLSDLEESMRGIITKHYQDIAMKTVMAASIATGNDYDESFIAEKIWQSDVAVNKKFFLERIKKDDIQEKIKVANALMQTKELSHRISFSFEGDSLYLYVEKAEQGDKKQ